MTIKRYYASGLGAIKGSVFLFMFGLALALYAQADDLCLAGVLSAKAAAPLKEGRSAGFKTELCLSLDSAPERGLRFRAEGGFFETYGSSSLMAGIFEAGLAGTPEEGALSPGADLHREFFLDQAYGTAELGFLELKAGIIPIGWGSAYFYNPTSRSAEPDFPGVELGRPRGKPGLAINAALPAGFLVEGYALAAARISPSLPLIDELDIADFPFGLRLQYRGDWIDLSAGLIRERSLPTSDAEYWISADAAGFLGPVDWYAEGGVVYDSAPLRYEVSVGLVYTLPVAELDLRAEYIHLEDGAEETEGYDFAAFMDGSKLLLGQNYVFAFVEKEDPMAAAWKLRGGGIMNLMDGSAAVLAEALWTPSALFELGCGAMVFTEEYADAPANGAAGEFGGGRPFGPGLAYYPYKSSVGLFATWFF